MLHKSFSQMWHVSWLNYVFKSTEFARMFNILPKKNKRLCMQGMKMWHHATGFWPTLVLSAENNIHCTFYTYFVYIYLLICTCKPKKNCSAKVVCFPKNKPHQTPTNRYIKQNRVWVRWCMCVLGIWAVVLVKELASDCLPVVAGIAWGVSVFTSQ